jgi:hypothetical protein
MRPIHVAVALTSVLAALAAWSPPARAFSYTMPTDTALRDQAEGVLVARIRDELAPAADGRLPQRRYLIEIERVLSGTPYGGSAVLRLPGTRDDAERRVFLPGIPALRRGDRVLLFHASAPDRELRAVQLSLGLFFETVDGDGRRWYQRDLDGAEALGGGRALQSWPRDAQRFEHWLAAGAHPRAADYFELPNERAARPKFNLEVFPGTGLPVRWFTFDDGVGVVTWQAQVGLPAGAAFNVDSAVTGGMEAWTGDPNSRIDYRFDFTRVASDPGRGAANGVNAVLWDDPFNDIPGSYNCAQLGGILGIGGQFFTAATRVFDGSEYHQALEGFMIIEDAAGCYLQSDVRAGEVFTHEFGHTLGFAHPCGEPGMEACSAFPVLDDATMRGRIHDDGRAAALRSDDRAAALRVYPDPANLVPQELLVDGVSLGFSGCGADGSTDASASADGSVIVFQTSCTPAKVGGPGHWEVPAKHDGIAQIYVYDRRTQCLRKASVSDGPDGLCGSKIGPGQRKAEPIGAPSIEPSVSADGDFIAFTAPTALVAAVHGESKSQREARRKAPGWSILMRSIVGNSTFQVSSGNSSGTGSQPEVAPDRRSITFVSNSLPENGAGETPDPQPDVFQIKPNPGGPQNGFGAVVCVTCKDAPTQTAGPPSVSANGEMVAFSLGNAVWLRNMVSGLSNIMVSPSAGVSTVPRVDYSGQRVVFQTTAPLEIDGSDTNARPDVYLYENCCAKFTRVSKPDVELPNPALQEPSLEPTISGDGRRIAFVSKAHNLMGYVPDANPHESVFVYDVKQRLKRRYSRGSSGAQANARALRPYLNYTGTQVLFDSAASNYDAGDGNGVADVFVRPNPLAEFVVFGSGFD